MDMMILCKQASQTVLLFGQFTVHTWKLRHLLIKEMLLVLK